MKNKRHGQKQQGLSPLLIKRYAEHHTRDSNNFRSTSTYAGVSSKMMSTFSAVPSHHAEHYLSYCHESPDTYFNHDPNHHETVT